MKWNDNNNEMKWKWLIMIIMNIMMKIWKNIIKWNKMKIMK